MKDEIKALVDEPTEQIGLGLVVLAAILYGVDQFAFDFVDGVELFWTIAMAGGSLYGAKLFALVKKVRDQTEPDDKE